MATATTAATTTTAATQRPASVSKGVDPLAALLRAHLDALGAETRADPLESFKWAKLAARAAVAIGSAPRSAIGSAGSAGSAPSGSAVAAAVSETLRCTAGAMTPICLVAPGAADAFVHKFVADALEKGLVVPDPPVEPPPAPIAVSVDDVAAAANAIVASATIESPTRFVAAELLSELTESPGNGSAAPLFTTTTTASAPLDLMTQTIPMTQTASTAPPRQFRQPHLPPDRGSSSATRISSSGFASRHPAAAAIAAATTFTVHVTHTLVADIIIRELGAQPNIAVGFTRVCRKWAAARRDGLARDEPVASNEMSGSRNAGCSNSTKERKWDSPFHTFWIQEERQSEQRVLFPAPFSYTPAPPIGLVVTFANDPSTDTDGLASTATTGNYSLPFSQPSFMPLLNVLNALPEETILNVVFKFMVEPSTPKIKDWTAHPELIPIRNGTYSFVWYIKHHEGIKYATIPKEISEVGLKLIRAPAGKYALIGVGQAVEEVERGLASYQNPQKGFDDIPRGFLFWGPPGTGKTTIVQRLSELLNVKLVCDPLTPGSFNQGIVGDSERMINTLAEWAKSIPWHVCVVAIDEIDGLAPSRENAHKDSGKTDIIGVLLALIGGIRNIPNLVLFGSTNLLHTMDAAFLRRMNYKIFIGRPSFDARRAFVSRVADSYRARHNNAVPFSSEDRELVDEFVKLTLNFSTDAVFKALNLAADNWVAEGAGEMLDSKMLGKYVRERAVMEKILFGGRYLPDILNSAVDESRAIDRFTPITQLTETMSRCTSGTTNKCTGRILVQIIGASRAAEEIISADKLNQIQVETVTKAGSSANVLEIRAILFGKNWTVSNIRNVRESLPKSCSAHKQQCPAICRAVDPKSLYSQIQDFEWALEEEYKISQYKRMNDAELEEDPPFKAFVAALGEVSQTSRANRESELRRHVSTVLHEFTRALGRPEKPNSIIMRDALSEQIAKRLLNFSDYPADLWHDMSDVISRRLRDVVKNLAGDLEDAIRPVTQFTVKRDLMTLQGDSEVEVYTKDEIMYKLLDYGINKDVSYIQLIDNGYLLANNRLDEASAKEALLQVSAEAGQYHSSILLFDLDSIAQIRTELRGNYTTDDPEENRDFVINRQDLFTMAVQYFKDLASQEETRHWVVAISEHAHILRLFKESVNWPKAAHERSKKSVSKCVHCEQVVSRMDRSWSCSRHRVEEVYSQIDYEVSSRSMLVSASSPESAISLNAAKTGNSTSNGHAGMYNMSTTPGLSSAGSPHLSLKFFSKTAAIDYARRTGRPYTDMKYRCCGSAVYGNGCLRAQHEVSE